MLKESISGVRGIVGGSLDSEVIARYSAAFANIMPPGEIIIARDSRPSGEKIAREICGILNRAGRDTVDIGIQATPTAEIVTAETDAIGGIIITASHNPIEWNGMKFLNDCGMFLGAEDFEMLRTTAAKTELPSEDATGISEIMPDAERFHINAILDLPWLDKEAIRKAKITVALDANGGTGSVVLLPLLEKLECRVIPIGCDADGLFCHNPEPRAEYLIELEKTVKDYGADIGLATDPDADRLALVDESGSAISEEYTLAIGAAEVLHFEPGPVVVNLSTSAMVESLGQPVIRTPVGEINVSRKMLEVGSPVGGEGNGGLIVPACHPGRDGLLAAAVIIYRMARTGKKLSQLAAEFPKLYMIKDKIEIHDKISVGSIHELPPLFEETFSPKAIDTTDGIRLTLENGWLHIRASNTEPVIRIIAEAESKELAKEIVEKARRLLN